MTTTPPATFTGHPITDVSPATDGYVRITYVVRSRSYVTALLPTDHRLGHTSPAAYRQSLPTTTTTIKIEGSL